MGSIDPYQARWTKLFERLPMDSALVLPSNTKQKRNSDAEYAFRQDSYFYYVSGLTEDKALLVFLKTKAGNQCIVFCEETTPLEARWQGSRLGLAATKKRLKAEAAYLYSELMMHLPKLLASIKIVYCPLSHPFHVKARLDSFLPKMAYQEAGLVLNELRLIKDDYEIALMRKAAEISAQAHIRAMKASKMARFEYELEAEFLYEFTRCGAKSPAYTSIVGGGNNACVLHYIDNDAPLQSGDLVLADAGAEYQYYAADITRVFPVNGRFSEPQKIIYELVLKAQLAGIAVVRPHERFDTMQEVIVDILAKGLLDLAIIHKKEDYSKYYMHRSGHWLGLDVHDVGDYQVKGLSRKLQPGMVLTVEPGLYFPEDCLEIDVQWRGIGVRIEDDVLVTPHEPDVLSRDAPKTVEAIEQLMQ